MIRSRRSLALALLVACSPRTQSTTAPTTTAPEPTSDVEATETPAGACPAVATPQSSAGRQLDRLVAAINAADDAPAKDFVAKEMSTSFREHAPLERHLQFIRGMHGDGPPVLVCRVESDTDDEIVALLGGHDDKGAAEFGRMFVRIDREGKVDGLGLERATADDISRPIAALDAAATTRIVDEIAKGLDEYVFADVRDEMAARIRKAAQAGDYASITSPRALATRLTTDLRAVSHDKHLSVVYSSAPIPPQTEGAEPPPEELARFKEQAARDNFGIPVAEIREGGIGYLDIRGFLPVDIAADAIATQLSKIADAKVLVIDLRNNGGGDPAGVARMCSYFFGKKKVHLNDIYTRSENRTEKFFTAPDAPGQHYGGKKPIYVLTSARTFSGGEEFAYNLKTQKRATLVGETTGGGAHPTKLVRIDEHWGVALPHARAINPITKTNWEGTGVKPDVEVPAAQALDKALELAAAKKPR
ncbi:MAG TPA: S41 family peptidase [Nannocystaceae bacterium]|nr:S41 family peptidase [Nannocystaceae bacterium]